MPTFEFFSWFFSLVYFRAWLTITGPPLDLIQLNCDVLFLDDFCATYLLFFLTRFFVERSYSSVMYVSAPGA